MIFLVLVPVNRERNQYIETSCYVKAYNITKYNCTYSCDCWVGGATDGGCFTCKGICLNISVVLDYTAHNEKYERQVTVCEQCAVDEINYEYPLHKDISCYYNKYDADKLYVDNPVSIFWSVVGVVIFSLGTLCSTGVFLNNLHYYKKNGYQSMS